MKGKEKESVHKMPEMDVLSLYTPFISHSACHNLQMPDEHFIWRFNETQTRLKLNEYFPFTQIIFFFHSLS